MIPDNDEIVIDEYRFRRDERGVLQCLRHGKPWRDFIGDNAVLMLYIECLSWRKAYRDLAENNQ